MASPLSANQTIPSKNPVPSSIAQLQSFLSDPPLPTNARIPARAFALGYSTNVVLDGLLPLALRKKAPGQALKAFMSLKSLQSGSASNQSQTCKLAQLGGFGTFHRVSGSKYGIGTFPYS
uniref:Uncharacterized protein n=1 Tax=Melanopsichium pennsylvanicum 4 TaxID=1398559 RepID=A0A077R245_9BASI|nr:conserved hypothetical protein [Melanopsichium pennsylvanicum 4]